MRATPTCRTTLFGKCPRDDERARRYNKVMNAYKREHGFYRDLAGRVPMTLARSFVNEYDDESGRAVLLIEKIEGTAGDILDGPDIEMFNELIRSARHDARSVLGQRCCSVRVNGAIDWSSPSLLSGIPILREDWPLMRQIWPDMGPVEILDFYERTWVYDTELWLERYGERPWTMIHGDYEFDNIFFAADGPVILDWQTTMKSFPGGDMAWFLGVGCHQRVGCRRRCAARHLPSRVGSRWGTRLVTRRAARRCSRQPSVPLHGLGSSSARRHCRRWEARGPHLPAVRQNGQWHDGLRGSLERVGSSGTGLGRVESHK